MKHNRSLYLILMLISVGIVTAAIKKADSAEVDSGELQIRSAVGESNGMPGRAVAEARPTADDFYISSMDEPVSPRDEDITSLNTTEDPSLKSLELESKRVVMPMGLTAYSAMLYVFRQTGQAHNYRQLLDEDTIAEIQAAPSTYYTEEPREWSLVLREILSPHNLDFIEEDDIVRIGFKEGISKLHRAYAQQRLENNHTRISVEFSGGTPLLVALDAIQRRASININYDWMEPADRGIAQPVADPKADDVAEAVPPGKLTTYSTPENYPVYWRTVLNEVLSPYNYGFIEVDGVVRIMTKVKVEEYAKSQIDLQPVALRLVRVHHASPEMIKEQIEDMPGLFKHSKKVLQVVRGEGTDAHSIRFRGSGLSTASGGSGESIGSGISGGTSFGNMERPRTPPSLLIGDLAENLDRIEEKVRKLDVRERQVIIEAKIFTVGANAMRNLGVDWGQEGARGRGSFRSSLGREEIYGRERTSSRIKESRYTAAGQQYSTQMDSTVRLDNEITRTRSSEDMTETGSLFEIGDFAERTFQRFRGMATGAGYSAILNPLELDLYWGAVQEVRDFKVVSQPMLVIGDHSEALIRVGVVEPAYTRLEVARDNQPPAISYEWQWVQTGIALWVIPEISPDGEVIRLSIHPQSADALDRVTAGPNGEGGSYPRLSIREIDTRVAVPNGDTLMLGGLIRSSGGKEQRKIPFLGSIPFLGRLFRWDADSREGDNLIILITPTILDHDAPDTGYERSAQPYLDDLMRGVGRNLGQPVPDFQGKITPSTPPYAVEPRNQQ